MKTATDAKLRARVVSRLKARWEWVLCFTVLLVLNLFLAGEDLFGLRDGVAAGLALLGGLVLPLVTFVFASLLAPLLGVVAAVASWVTAVVLLPVLGFVMGSIVVPVLALVTGVFSSVLAWVAGTWLGTLLMPAINLLSPLVLKFGPWLAFAKNSEWAWRKVNQLRTALGYGKLTKAGKLKRTPKVGRER
ncbi:MAG: hypothetical protein H6922_02670 [Pseudomonadaceae bacterium]|nr:hypothetical protein [Pseudomonadaceae bacterium]